MNTKQAMETLESLDRLGEINSRHAYSKLSEVIESLGSEAAALRDHLQNILAVVSEEESEASGPFKMALAYLKEADVGGAELDYRNALEEAAKACLESFSGSEMPAIKRLSGVLSQSPAMFIKRDRLALFLDWVVSILDRFKASDFSIRWPLPIEQEHQLRRIVLNTLSEAVNLSVGLDFGSDSCWAKIEPKHFDESKAQSAGAPDRLDDLLSGAADEAMDQISSLYEGTEDTNPFMDKHQFKALVLKAIEDKLEFEFEVSVGEHVRSTTFCVKLKGEKS